MMEFYCGLHLARNSQPGWVVQETDPQRPETCALRRCRCAAAGQRSGMVLGLAVCHRNVTRGLAVAAQHAAGVAVGAVRASRKRCATERVDLPSVAAAGREQGGRESGSPMGSVSFSGSSGSSRICLTRRTRWPWRCRTVSSAARRRNWESIASRSGWGAADDDSRCSSDDERPRHQVVVSPFSLAGYARHARAVPAVRSKARTGAFDGLVGRVGCVHEVRAGR